MKGYCEDCKTKDTCKKLIGKLSGFCMTDFEPLNPPPYRYEVHVLARPYGEVLTVDGFETEEAAEKFYNALPPEEYADLIKTDLDGNFLENLLSNY